MSYQGEVIATIEGVELRQLTPEERRGGPQYYCLAGVTHWNPIEFFLKQAEDHERTARLLRAAHAEVTAEQERTYREDTAAQLWATLSPGERQSFIAGSYTEEKATEWLARVGQPPVPQGLYEAFDTRSHWEPIADAMVRIRLAELPDDGKASSCHAVEKEDGPAER